MTEYVSYQTMKGSYGVSVVTANQIRDSWGLPHMSGPHVGYVRFGPERSIAYCRAYRAGHRLGKLAARLLRS